MLDSYPTCLPSLCSLDGLLHAYVIVSGPTYSDNEVMFQDAKQLLCSLGGPLHVTVSIDAPEQL